MGPSTGDRSERSLGCLDGPIDDSDRELLKGLTPTEAKQLAELLARVGNDQE